MPAPNVVALCTDQTLFPVAMFAAQRLAKLNTRDDVEIILFTSSPATLESARAADVPFTVELVKRPDKLADGLLSEATYLRFFALNALADRRRVLYVDSDIYPESASVFSLFDLDLGSHAFAAVRDLVVSYWPGPPERQDTLGADNHKYLNAGVLLVDMRRYEQERIYTKVVNLVRKRAPPFRFFDQSALNVVLQGAWVELSPAFNMLLPAWNSFLRQVFTPVILHFAGSLKPWHGPAFDIQHPARAEMEAYLTASPWKGFLAQQFGLKDALALLSQRQTQAAGSRTGRLSFDRDFTGRPAFLHFFRSTEFADVKQGLTSAHWENLPPA